MSTQSFYGGAAAAVVAVCLAMLVTCSVKPAVTATDADNGTRVELKKGEVLAVRLSAQLGTGFGWKVADHGGTLELMGEPEQVAGAGRKPGGPGFQTFKFKAVDRGESVLKLRYLEAWKKEAKPIREFAITVTVR
jgi:predicted secreted protein